MAEMKPLKITFYARVGDSEVLNELAVIERNFVVEPLTDENRAPGDAANATIRVTDVEGLVRQVVNAIERSVQ